MEPAPAFPSLEPRVDTRACPAICTITYINTPFSTFFLPAQLTYKMMAPQRQDSQTAVFCDTAAKCQTAATAFETCPAVVLDCEGHNLGTSGGKLSIILLRGVTADSQTFLIDVPKLSFTSILPILDLLRSPNIRKIVFDGRMDFSALYHELGVELQNVVDLQLVDIMSRFARGERWETQQKRLRSTLKTDELRTCPQLYVQVHRLHGLDGCIAEHKVIPKKAGKPFKSKGQSG